MEDITSYKNKIVEFGTRQGSFKDEETNRQIDYTQIVLVLSFNGVEKEITLSSRSAPKPTDLELFLSVAEEQ